MSQTSEPDGTAAVPRSTPAQNDRALHVLVPEDAIIHARRAALDSKPRLSFRHFVAQLLLQARPIVNKECGSTSSEQERPPAFEAQHQAAEYS